MSDAARAGASEPASDPIVVGYVVVGYVEAVTTTAVLGWVWRPNRPEKVRVELRLGGKAVAEAVADGKRDDLARNGIGGGEHAFILPVPDGLQSRANELLIFALPEGEQPVQLETPPRPDATADRLAQMQRGIEMLIGSQRLMHRNLQAALLQQGPSVSTSLAEVAASQGSLQESIATFEMFAVRLEQALLGRDAPVSVTTSNRFLATVAAISAISLVASCIALARVVMAV